MIKKTITGLTELFFQPESIVHHWKNKNVGNPNKRLPILKKMMSNQVSPWTVLDECGIIYHSPADASHTGLPDSSIDIVFSNLVLNEIPITNLEEIFKEAYRILKPSGIMLNLIDCSDQFAYGQKEKTSINFLQYSEKEFSKYCSPLLYQNRLRPPQYRAIFEKYSFNIKYWRTRVDAKSYQQIEKLKNHADFLIFSPEEICTNAIYVLAKKEPI